MPGSRLRSRADPVATPVENEFVYDFRRIAGSGFMCKFPCVTAITVIWISLEIRRHNCDFRQFFDADFKVVAHV